MIGLVHFSGLTAQTVDVNERCLKAYSDIISLRMDQGHKWLELEKKENPQNYFPVYLENLLDFLQVFISEEKALYEQMKNKKSERIAQLEKLPDSNPYKNYLLSNMRLQWAMAGTKFGDYFSTAMDIRRAYLGIVDNVERFPDFKPQYATLGVLHIIIGMVPEKYHWILSLISLQGSVAQGTEELYEVLALTDKDETVAYLKPEILFYLGFTEMNLSLDQQKKRELMQALKPYVQTNLLLGFLRANMLMRSADNDSAAILLTNLIDKKGYMPFYYLYYLKGETGLRSLNTDSKKDFQFFIDRFGGVNYLKDARRKIAWCWLLEGDTVQYKKQLAMVNSLGDDFVGVDKEAQKESDLKKIPNVALLKARLLFDGGYYQKALAVLGAMDTTRLSAEEKLERTYRMGRLYQELLDFPKAKEFFEKTIEKGSASKRYFAGNAALQLGLIYEEKGNWEQAKRYYLRCMELDFDEYETSIKEKAKQGIERIKNINNG